MDIQVVNHKSLRGFIKLSENYTQIICYTPFSKVSELSSIKVRVPIEQLLESANLWTRGSLIQDSFPYLSADQREFMLSGLTPDEFNQL